jgi:iron complex outermembrane receptor protein
MDRAGRQGLRHRPRRFQHRRAGRERDRQLEAPEPILGSEIAVKSITAWRKLDSIFGADHDHSPVLIDHTFNDYSQRQFSQELQVTGSSKLLNWAAGVYYFRESGTDANTVDFSIGSLLSGGAIRNRSLAFYGQATLNITQALSITGGIRHTDEDKLFLPNQVYLTDFVASPTQILPAGTRKCCRGQRAS